MYRLILLVIMLGFIFTGNAWAQAVGQVELGCKTAWEEPTIDDPANPGTQIGAWAHAGDLWGFAFVLNENGEGETWDPLQEVRKEDPALRELSCDDWGLNSVGTKTIGIKALDDSMNASGPAWLTFEVIVKDSNPPANLLRFCLEGIVKGNAVPSICTAPLAVP